MNLPSSSPRVVPQRTVLAPDASILTVANFLRPQECAAFIRLTEQVGYDEAPITTSRGFVKRPEVRNNTRVMVDDVVLAGRLWELMEGFAVKEMGPWRAVGLNERFRFYRYTQGQYFKYHSDGAFHRSEREQSLFTAMVYLNEGFTGGSTDFFEGPSIVPREGLLLLFEHGLRHQGAPVREGCKYVLRTDVMFRL